MLDNKVQIEGVITDKYPGYIITKEGEVYSLARERFLDKTLRKRNSSNASSKYDEFVHLQSKGFSASVAVHRLLALAFIPNPEMKGTVNHKDGNPANNSLSNLEWMTQSENSKHASDNALATGRYTRCVKSELVCQEVEQLSFNSLVEGVRVVAGVTTNSSPAHISVSKNKGIPSGAKNARMAYGYIWRYSEVKPVKTSAVVIESTLEIDKVLSKPIEGFACYLVTIDGRIYNIKRSKWVKVSKIKSPRKNTEYFARCTLINNEGKEKKLKVARLVAIAFKKDWPNVGFKNNNTLDCRAENLKEVNQSHAERSVTLYRQEWREEVIESYDSIAEAASTVSTTATSVSDVVNKNRSIEAHEKFNSGDKPYTSAGFIFRGLRSL